MSNEYFEFDTGRMVSGEDALAADVNNAFDGVVAGFEKLPTPDNIKFMSAGYAVTGGSGGNYTLAVTADAYFDGMMVSFKANHANSGAATLNVNSLGAKSLISMGGGGALVVGDVLANHIYTARYNSTSSSFELQGLSAGSIADVQTVSTNIADIATIADNIDEVLLADDSATAAAASALEASGYASDASDSADAAATSAANLPNATIAGADKLIKTNAAGDGWEYPSVTAAGLAILDDDDASAQRATLGVENVDNTSDADKPISTATAAEFAVRPRKNAIINGNFDIWQRGTSQTGTGYGSDDRWFNYASGTTIVHSRQSFTVGQTDVPGNPRYYSRTVVTSVAGASNYAVKTQKIESVYTFAGENVTLSFYAKANASKNMSIYLEQDFGGGGSAGVRTDAQKIALTTSWKRFSLQFSVGSISGKTIGSDGKDCLRVWVYFDDGSVFTNSPGKQSGTFDIAQVQLELGAAATSFERRLIAEEYNLCKYYFTKVGTVVSTSSINNSVETPKMRAIPALSPSPTFNAGTGATFAVVSGTGVYTLYQTSNHSDIASAFISLDAEL